MEHMGLMGQTQHAAHKAKPRSNRQNIPSELSTISTISNLGFGIWSVSNLKYMTLISILERLLDSDLCLLCQTLCSNVLV